MNIQNIELLFDDAINQAEWTVGYTIHGVHAIFSSNSEDLTNEVNRDLKWFNIQDPNLHSKISIIGLLNSRLDEHPLSFPPRNSVVVWKSQDEAIVSYSSNNLIINYYYEEAIRVIEVLDLKKGRSLCIGDSLIPLYEVSLLSFEKQVSSCLEREKIYLLHAASLGKDGKGILFPATNSFGKTNLTITLLQFGFNLLSDDKVFIDTGKNRALYYPRRLRVNRNSIKRLKGLDFLLKRDPSRFLGNEERWLIDTDENNLGMDISLLPEVELCMILFPTIWINDASKIIPSEPRRSLPRLLQSFEWPMNFEKRKIAFQLITGIKCFELLMGSKPEELGRLMVDLWERETRS